MDRRVEILVEERSMEEFLKGFLPRILPDGFSLGYNCFIHAHEGKQHLMKMLPNRLRAYQYYPVEVFLIVIHDQDSADCLEIKARIQKIISKNAPHLPHLIRIACRELENWYIGDLDSVEQIYPASKSAKLSKKAKFRNPDLLTGSDELKKMASEFSKISCARNIAPILDVDGNTSVSFGHLVSGIRRFLGVDG